MTAAMRAGAAGPSERDDVEHLLDDDDAPRPVFLVGQAPGFFDPSSAPAPRHRADASPDEVAYAAIPAHDDADDAVLDLAQDDASVDASVDAVGHLPLGGRSSTIGWAARHRRSGDERVDLGRVGATPWEAKVAVVASGTGATAASGSGEMDEEWEEPPRSVLRRCLSALSWVLAGLYVLLATPALAIVMTVAALVHSEGWGVIRPFIPTEDAPAFSAAVIGDAELCADVTDLRDDLDTSLVNAAYLVPTEEDRAYLAESSTYLAQQAQRAASSPVSSAVAELAERTGAALVPFEESARRSAAEAARATLETAAAAC